MPHVGGAEEILPDISASQTPPMNDITLSRSNVARLWHSWRKKGGHTESWGRLNFISAASEKCQPMTEEDRKYQPMSCKEPRRQEYRRYVFTWYDLNAASTLMRQKISSAGETLVLKCFFLSALQQRYSPHHVHASSHKYVSYCTKTRKQTKVQVFKIKAERK